MIKITLILFLIICSSFAQGKNFNIWIDHIPVIVKNLKSAEKKFSKAGFKIKSGRLHKNGLKNSFIKFEDNSEIELMSVAKNSDKITNSYLNYLSEAEGGTYISFGTNSILELQKYLQSAKISTNIINSKAFTYLTFNDKSIQHIFFINYKIKPQTNKSFYNHPNKTKGIKSVTISGDDKTEYLLRLIFSGSDKNIFTDINENRIILKKPDDKKLFRVKEVSLKNLKLNKILNGLKIK